MLPSSSSQLARYGQINHYKKFWLLQTQLEKQDQSSTSLSLQGTTGNTNIPTVVKENKPLSSSLTVHGDHNTVGHGSCRAVLDIGASSTSCSTSRGGANFPYSTSIEPSTTTMKFYTNGLCHSHIHSGSLRDSPPLSLAVNCENVAHINFVNQRSWPAAPPLQPNSVSDAPLLPLTSTANFQSFHPRNGQVLVSSVATEDLCESSECSTGGEKRAGYWDISTSFHSCTTSQHITPALHEVPAPATLSLRGGPHGSASVLRTCSLCGTTKTPLWRSGPDGPKSLCNACGIRVKKSKRLQAAMEAAGEDVQQVAGSSSSSRPSSSYKRLQLSTTKSAGRGGALKRKHSIQAAENASDPIFQKRKKMVGYRRSSCWSPSSLAELRSSQDGGFFSDAGEGTAKLAAGIVMDRKSSSKDIVSNMFAKDVEEAAVLLMALSCGLVLS